MLLRVAHCPSIAALSLLCFLLSQFSCPLHSYRACFLLVSFSCSPSLLLCSDYFSSHFSFHSRPLPFTSAHLFMASLIATLQSTTPALLCRRDTAHRFIAGDSGFGTLKIAADFAAPVGRDFPHYVVCSTSSRARDFSPRRNSRSPSRHRRGGASASKPVSVLPGDMKLLRDLQEFISAADLPPHQVPSTRELARRGRQDLANAVRRRGEKALSQLLSNPNFLSSSGAATKHSNPMPAMAAASKLDVDDNSNGVLNPEIVPSSSIRPQASTDATQTTDLVPRNRIGLFIPRIEAGVESRPSNVPYQNDCATFDDPMEVTNFGSSSISHAGKKSKQGLPRTLDVANLSEVTAAYEDGDSDDEDDTELYTYEDSIDDEDNNSPPLKTVKSSEESEENKAWQKAAILRSKLIAFFDKPVGNSATQSRRDLTGGVFDIMAQQRESQRFLQHGDTDMLSPVGADPLVELARLSALLHTKEMQNLRVSRELEEAKAMLALVRAKHIAELAQAKQVAVEQDLRLHGLEQALHSLKLTQVDWWGEANRVELAGSFNGWQHHAYLLPDLSTKASPLPGTQGPLLWRVELWLYPGVYEIKFVVDGKWVLDNRREVVQGHMGENNLLYVEP